MTKEKNSLTASERKRLQRQRDKLLGWVEVTVKVPHTQVDELRAFIPHLGTPPPIKDTRQLDMIEMQLKK
jgi:hypothetical protein